MYSGHLTEKKGYFYCVITYKTSEGKRKEKWFSTKLPVKGNKRRAEALLQEYRRTFVPPKEDSAFDALDSTMPFTAYIRLWLDYAKPTVAPTTFGGYQSTIEKKFIPYFERLNLTLQEVKPKHLHWRKPCCKDSLRDIFLLLRYTPSRRR